MELLIYRHGCGERTIYRFGELVGVIHGSTVVCHFMTRTNAVMGSLLQWVVLKNSSLINYSKVTKILNSGHFLTWDGVFRTRHC